MRGRINVTVLLVLVMVLTSGVAFGKTIDTSIKGSTGTLRFDPPGPYRLQYCDYVRVTNSTDPQISVTVYTKNSMGVVHESKAIPAGENNSFHYTGPDTTVAICVTETMMRMDEVCEDLITAVPTLTQWGMIIFALLILASGIWMLRRRRRLASLTN
jgi:hypothetical protein